MIKLKNLKSNFQFRKLLGQKKIHTDYFSVYFGKNLMKENDNKLNISFIIKKKQVILWLEIKLKEDYDQPFKKI